MAKKRIVKTTVDALGPGETAWDTIVRGFGVRRQRRDAVYVVKYSLRNKQRLVTIGPHGAPWTPETARKEAQRLIGAVSHGTDPAAERDRRKAEPTVADVLDRYVREHVGPHNRATTASEARRLVERELKPTFGKLRIGELTRAQVKSWHSTFSERPYTGNRALAYLRKALNLAHKDWELRSDNPAKGVKLFPEKRRERFFSDDELSRIGAALATIEADGSALPGAARVVRLLALSGMRLGEVLALEWSWIDFDAGCVRLPDAKAGARAVPLGGPALSYLSKLERIGPFVCFGANPMRPIGEKTFRHTWGELVKRAGLVNGRPHDFRHTVGTFTAQTGANAFQVRDILGHRTLAMTAKYVERSVDPLRKTADQVASRISAAMDGGTNAANVVPPKTAR